MPATSVQMLGLPSRFHLALRCYRRQLPLSFASAVSANAHALDTKTQETTAGKTQASRIYLLSHHQPEATTFPEALRALRAYSLSEIPETVEVSLKMDMTLKKSKVRDPFRGSLLYPHSFGTERKLLFFVELYSVQLLFSDKTQESLAEQARMAGADVVGGEELIAKVQEGDLEFDFDVCLSTPGMYDKLRPLQKKLRAKMPTPKRGTVVENIAEGVAQFKRSLEYKCDRHGYLNTPVGKLDFPNEHILENLRSLLEAVRTHRNHLPMTTFVKRAVLSSTYGPGFLFTIREFL